jgi:galactose mutarotase-like enzyme
MPGATISLDDGGSQLSIADDLGGLVTSLVLGGREWLFRNEAIPLESRRQAQIPPGARRTAYVDLADCGWGDTCFPTVGGDEVRRPDGTSSDLLDHGLLWNRPSSTQADSPHSATTTWQVQEGDVAFTFRRTLTLEGGGRLAAALSVVNTGLAPLPHFWSSHDMVPLTADTRLELPAGTPFRVFSAHGLEATLGGHAWPLLSLGSGAALDLSHPAAARAALGRDFAVKIFSAEDAGPLAVREGARSLELSGPGTRAGVWINWGGWAPDAVKARGVRYQSLCPERCIGGPTDLPSEGLALGTTAWVHPGESRAWSLRYRAG